MGKNSPLGYHWMHFLVGGYAWLVAIYLFLLNPYGLILLASIGLAWGRTVFMLECTICNVLLCLLSLAGISLMPAGGRRPNGQNHHQINVLQFSLR